MVVWQGGAQGINVYIYILLVTFKFTAFWELAEWDVLKDENPRLFLIFRRS